MKKSVLITGVCGGVGRATADVFADNGWRVIGVDVRVASTWRPDVEVIMTDISDAEQIASIERHLAGSGCGLDALVNNAAVQVCKPVLETSLEEWDCVMSSNLRAVFLLTKRLHPFLRPNQGAVVNVSSVHAIATSQGIAAYATSKGGLLALTRVMALEFASDRIRVNVVLPGAVDTAMLRAGLTRDRANEGEGHALADLASRHPMERVGRPEEIAEAILFLSDNRRSSFMTGQSMVVDGGATARLSTE